MSLESKLTKQDLTCEEWREYDIPGREKPYRINDPKELYYRLGGSTHRVVDQDNVVHCLPVPGSYGTVLRWKSKDPEKPVNF